MPHADRRCDLENLPRLSAKYSVSGSASPGPQTCSKRATRRRSPPSAKKKKHGGRHGRRNQSTIFQIKDAVMQLRLPSFLSSRKGPVRVKYKEGSQYVIVPAFLPDCTVVSSQFSFHASFTMFVGIEKVRPDDLTI
jgi:hypothetical protein